MQTLDVFQLFCGLLDATSVSMNSRQIPFSHKATHISTKLESVFASDKISHISIKP